MHYKKLAELYDTLEKRSKKLEKTFFISQFLLECNKEDLKDVLYLLQGRVFPQWDERKLGMGSKLLVKAIAVSSGNSSEQVEEQWKKLGDLGLVAEKFLAKKKQHTLVQHSLTIQKVVENIQKLAVMEGEGTVQKKVGMIAELLGSADGLEARYVVRTVAEELRTGVGDAVLRDALVWAFFPKILGIFYPCAKCHAVNPHVSHCLVCGEKMENKFSPEKNHKGFVAPKSEAEARELYNKDLAAVQHAFNVSNDWGVLAELLQEKGVKGLEHALLVVGKPVKAMLYPKVKDIAEGFEVVGKPAMIEPKLDGFRAQIHRNKESVKIFTRSLEDVTAQFPDIVKAVKTHVRSKDVILDSEITGIDPRTKHVLPFQHISQRIKRKYDIEQLVKTLPVVVNIFDVIELNGETMLDVPFEERRKKLKAVVKDEKHSIEVIEQLITSDLAKAEKYYHECLAKGHEGIMMKSIQGIYKPGKRVGQGVKVKPVMESLDLVIVAAEWGEGKRATWLSSYTVACRDKNHLKELGKVSTGLKEKSEEGTSFEELTKELKKNIIQEKGREVLVKPKIVVEVIFEEIQKSPSNSSGYALRFPRILRLREDKGVHDISTLQEVHKHYEQQK